MRTFIIAAFVLVASFGTPLFASAQSCVSAGDECFYSGTRGTCMDVGTEGLFCNTTGGTGGTVNSGGTESGGTVTTNPGQGNNAGTGRTITLINPLKGGGNLQSFLLSILDLVIKIGGVIIVLMIVFVGFKFVAAQGEPGKLTEAKKMLLWTVVGALILLGSKAIATGIQATVTSLGG